MLISLSEIMNQKNEVRTMTVPIELENFRRDGAVYDFADKGSVSLKLENLGDKKVKIELKAEVSLRVPCDRCLKEVIVPISVDFSKEMDFKKTEEQRIKDLDDTSYFIGYDLDVDELIYEELLIGFPMKVLCKKDCKGICNICGTDLNQGECGCNRTELDPRMSVIRDIFKEFKEV